ncbi:MAG: four helix bundle protein [Chloroflexota bacterium]
MSKKFEDLVILKTAESIADEVWDVASNWAPFEKDTIGKQLVRAIDSVGANIAESYGRYHYGEKIQFVYYARGSLFESKYWLNRAHTRNLIPEIEVTELIRKINNLAKQLNGFLGHLRHQKRAKNTTLKEPSAFYDYFNQINEDTPPNNK